MCESWLIYCIGLHIEDETAEKRVWIVTKKGAVIVIAFTPCSTESVRWSSGAGSIRDDGSAHLALRQELELGEVEFSDDSRPLVGRLTNVSSDLERRNRVDVVAIRPGLRDLDSIPLDAYMVDVFEAEPAPARVCEEIADEREVFGALEVVVLSHYIAAHAARRLEAVVPHHVVVEATVPCSRHYVSSVPIIIHTNAVSKCDVHALVEGEAIEPVILRARVLY